MHRLPSVKNTAAEAGATPACRRVDLTISLQILIPEETFTPIEYACATHEFSSRGIRIGLEQLPSSIYVKLMSHPRYARITMCDPLRGNKIKLTGRIVWLDYQHNSGDTLNGSCQMAISFENQDKKDLSNFIHVRGESAARIDPEA